MKEYIKRLPKGWDEITLETFLKIIELIPNDTNDTNDIEKELDLNIELLSILLDEDESVLNGLPMTEMLKMIGTINFLSTPPVKGKPAYKLKKHTELSYDDFITFQKLNEKAFENMIEIIQIFSINKVENEEILKINMFEIFNSFHLLHQSTRQYLNFLKISLGFRLLQLRVKELFKKKHK